MSHKNENDDKEEKNKEISQRENRDNSSKDIKSVNIKKATIMRSGIYSYTDEYKFKEILRKIVEKDRRRKF